MHSKPYHTYPIAFSSGSGALFRAFSLLILLALSMQSLAQSEPIDNLLSGTQNPDKQFTPQQVVQIVVQSLQQNTADDAGIATVFRFASPGNKRATGPLSRFSQMIKRGFPDMLNHIGARYEPMEITGNTAVQAVWLQTRDGQEYGYAFQLGKQSGGETDGAWMTDAVVPLGKGKNSGIGI